MDMKRSSGTLSKFLFLGLFILCIPVIFSAAPVFNRPIIRLPKPPVFNSTHEDSLYKVMLLDSLGLSREAFHEALTGYSNLEKTGTIQKARILSIIDFSLPSFKKRLFVIDLSQCKLLFNTLVAHGKNSGSILATRFSNRNRSRESSLGFYLTGDSYVGKKGYSLRLLGMEAGINDNALQRGIVMHAASYVSEERANALGHVGRSEGCPAIPQEVHKAVIETIKEGSCFFIYGQDKKYPLRSKILQPAGIS